MSPRAKRVATTIALFLVFTVSEVYVGVSFAGAPAGKTPARAGVAAPQQATGILATQGSKPISVNGASVISGATLVSGAIISTPDRVSASVNLGALGNVEIAPNTNLTLAFDQSGTIRVLLRTGCVTVLSKKGTSGEVDTTAGRGGATDASKNSVLGVCLPVGASAPIVTVGATATAATAAGAGGLLGLGAAATAAVIGGSAAAVTTIALATRGTNPSPDAP